MTATPRPDGHVCPPTDRAHGLCPDCVAARTTAEREAQGLPPTAAPAQLARLAQLGGPRAAA